MIFEKKIMKHFYLIEKKSKSFFLQIHKILNFKKITFSFITFDSDDLQECTIPQNNGLNQNNLVSFIANFSKTTVNMLKTGICQSQILGIPLYVTTFISDIL